MPKKSTREKSHPQCAAAAREAVDAVRAEKDREIERLRMALDATEEEVARLQMVRDAYGREIRRLRHALTTIANNAGEQFDARLVRHLAVQALEG